MRLKFYLVLVLSYLSYFKQLPAQNETQKWHFGQNAGLDFSSNPPTIITNCVMNVQEGCAGISDNQGNLLLYTDGVTVYNQANAVMANGTGLFGDGSTTQSAIIVKRPASNKNYYIFTLAQWGYPSGLQYSEVDMSLAAGMGSVTIKNVPLYNPSCEKLAGVKHCNGRDTWVISHDFNSAGFRAYLVTAAGVSLTPVISNAGISIPGSLLAGQLKISSDGKKIACVCTDFIGTSFPIQVFDFDAATGVVSNPLSFAANPNYYGCEFSPDATKLYAAFFNNPSQFLLQFDLCSGTAAGIASSSMVIPSTLNSGMMYSFQLASDNKIYVARYNKSYVSVINSPNLSGAACNFVDAGQSITPGVCLTGLPNFVASFFKPFPLSPVTYTPMTCNAITFNAANTTTMAQGCGVSTLPLNVSWTFGDPLSGSANSSTQASVSHSFSAQGMYTITLLEYYPCRTDTTRLPLMVNTFSTMVNVAGNFTICAGQTKTYTVSGASSYSWSTGSTLTTVPLSPTLTTVYNVTGTSTNSCKASKQFTVTVSKCTGIETVAEQDNSLLIYPNPSSGSLYVETASPVKLKILDNNGLVVLERSFESGKHKLDISHFSNGIYTIQSVNQQGIKMMRLVKTE